ncbi:MAG: redoxin domain-containing protein [Candidatus Didemnitutus sp.]|nr:redoxin domain-containing protein [Candidatus Didemnitutus sp.]
MKIKSLVSSLVAVVLATTVIATVTASPVVGQPAPDFTLTDINGVTHTLSSFQGRTVVLEWVNPECPFVVKHYDKSGNIPATQKAARDQGVVWLLINSGHPGAQGDFDKAKVDAWMVRTGASADAYFRDQDGKIGKLYDARTTPHMYIIDATGTLVYAGGIDDIRSSNPADIAKATNYVTVGLAEMSAGKAISTNTSRPYGCSVKYSN